MLKERESNMELFRIIATLMIVVVHCNGWLLREWGDIHTWAAGRDIWVGGTRALIQSLTCIGVDCFVMISGYFGIHPKLKSIVKLILTLLFFYVGCYLATVWLGQDTFAWNKLLDNCLVLSRENWFIQCYLFLILLSPVLNGFVDNCKEKTLVWFIIAYMLCAFYFGCVHDSQYFYFNQGYSITTFIPIYIIGRYVKLYGMDRLRKYSRWLPWISYLVSLMLIMFIRLFSTNEGRWLTYNSPILIVSSALLLTCFASVRLHSKVINWVGISCLAVYLFHTSVLVLPWLAQTDVNLFMNNSFVMYMLKMAFVVVGIFGVSILLDKVRIVICNPIMKLIDKYSISNTNEI